MASGNVKKKFFCPDYSKMSAIKSSPYTVQDNGFVYLSITFGWTPCGISINNTTVLSGQIVNTDSYPISISGVFPVAKGDIVKSVINNTSVNSATIRFIPYR